MDTERRSIRLSALAAQLSAKLIGGDADITGVGALRSATPGQITYLSNPRMAGDLAASAATAVVVRDVAGLPAERSYLVGPDPALLFARIAQQFNPRPASSAAIHPSAVIATSATLGAGVEIGPHVVIEDDAVIGPGAQVKAGTFVGARTRIGAGTVLMPRVVIAADCVVGERCRVDSGAVIGSDGFGNAWATDHWERVPQIGRVVIGDDVEVGANTTIDRGSLDDTCIESGVRLDNQIQIAHGVRIGHNSAMAACAGVAGSTEIGAHCLIGGGAMIAGHLRIADRVTVLAGSGVPSSIDEGGVYASGVPIVPHKTWLRNMVQLKKLDQLAKRVRQLERTAAGKAPDADGDEKTP
jgi:UDP-3-O-[3-hydroxymyristoyl] glucosamine N-acyltransferase